MAIFLDILTGITLPVLVLVGLGWIAQTRLGLDLETLSRLTVNVILPAALVHFLTSAEIPLIDIWPTAWFMLLQFAAHYAMGYALGHALRGAADMRHLLGFAVAFANSGNYGLPLIALSFPPDFLLHQTIAASTHMVLISTLGVWLMARSGPDGPSMGKLLFGTPLLPAVAVGLLFKGFEVSLPVAVTKPLELMGDAFTPMALFLLGAQLTTVTAEITRGPLASTAVLKLLAAPAVTWGLAAATGFSDAMVAFFVVGTATPTGIMLAVFAAQYRAHAPFAAAAVFFTTVLSALTVTGWIFAMKLAGLMP
ncbi:MAG: AEC family transporter [Dichotomicrobium sp.]